VRTVKNDEEKMGTIISLTDVLKDPKRSPIVINDAALLIAEEVQSKKGFSGTLVKSGYAVVKRLNKGRMIHEVLEGLLPEFVDAIEPLHKAYREGDTSKGFDVTLVAKDEAATQALLSVTDKRSKNTKHKVIQKTYEKLRPRAEEHVKLALPGLGRLIDKHTKS